MVLQANTLGTISQCSGRGATSNTATGVIASTAPGVTLELSYNGGQMITLSGQVTDEDPGNPLISFSGVVDGDLHRTGRQFTARPSRW